MMAGFRKERTAERVHCARAGDEVFQILEIGSGNNVINVTCG